MGPISIIPLGESHSSCEQTASRIGLRISFRLPTAVGFVDCSYPSSIHLLSTVSLPLRLQLRLPVVCRFAITTGRQWFLTDEDQWQLAEKYSLKYRGSP
jgi:hypothetical protein